ncbi:hypothetical protein [Vibrio hangzhouensis]|uniref:Uncharacterized protein n=1 Tax=Vibrio hangzhouensis TaxID=462991 RepID=A0A1H5YFI1_9VIBR|nr:hypothetical protein [Vibrio hangzhouensis]MBY6196686.1 hypothetical protein [Vibrio hangzhouensis]SEG22455.1 hypothetical protein SAMN04488244_10945 [Vibrio hangzhouensis]
MITVDKQDAITLKIAHVMANSKKLDLDVFLFIPNELGMKSHLISESDFYYDSMSQKRAYFSNETLLPLVHSRLAKRGRLSNTQYRVSLSLFAYQYAMALDKAIATLKDTTKEELTADEIDEVIELAIDILRKLRRSVPFEENLKRHYANIDNYLSWYTGQKFLELVVYIPNGKAYTPLKERLITIVEKEQAHRNLNNYNSDQVRKDATRLSNKMRLLRRLIEHPIVLQVKMTSMGNNTKRFIKGIATGLVMLFVTSAVILARDYLGEITASFILVMSVIYALREVFKDDLRDIMWRWIQRGKPKWRRRFIDATTKKEVGKKIEWLDYITFEKLPDRIKNIRKKRVVQREEEILHYRAITEMATSKFTSGYDQTRETLNINFRALTRLMDKSNNRFYKLKDGQVVKESLEKRHLLNLIIKEHNKGSDAVYYRWKIILSRSKIVDIEQIPL